MDQAAVIASYNSETGATMYPGLTAYIKSLVHDSARMTSGRRTQLQALAEMILNKSAEELARLNFICTHNSRRSQMCQIWAATFAAWYGLERVEIYSGGTEVTAFNPRAVEAVRRAGFKVNTAGSGTGSSSGEQPLGENVAETSKNPHYQVYYKETRPPVLCFSKLYDDPGVNPTTGTVAVMTCSEADQNCPFIPGADHRISLPYKDPKTADGTPREKQVYDERCRQIAAEMQYLMSKVSSRTS